MSEDAPRRSGFARIGLATKFLATSHLCIVVLTAAMLAITVVNLRAELPRLVPDERRVSDGDSVLAHPAAPYPRGRPVSAASPTNAWGRLVSWSTTVSNSWRWAVSSPPSESRLVTAALIEVSGVRKSCVTESSKADLRRSPSCAASAC